MKNYEFSYLNIDLEQVCGACPEAYKAYQYGSYVGYLRLRHGIFTVDFERDGSCQRIWTVNPIGDGVFTQEERQNYLEGACRFLAVACL